jgi:hypothetical protein
VFNGKSGDVGLADILGSAATAMLRRYSAVGTNITICWRLLYIQACSYHYLLYMLQTWYVCYNSNVHRIKSSSRLNGYQSCNCLVTESGSSTSLIPKPSLDTVLSHLISPRKPHNIFPSRSILDRMLPTTFLLDLASDRFLNDFQIKIPRRPISCLPIQATCPAHRSCLDFTTRTN